MPKMTKAHHARYARLRAELDATRNAIYAAAPNRNTPFSDCWNLADAITKDRHETARRHLIDFECAMVAERRAWRASYGFQPY